jgi:hypothetical protein
VKPDRQSVVHQLYGIRIRTPWPVAGVPVREGSWDVEFVEGNAAMFANAAAHVPAGQAARWAQYAGLPDGSKYRRWNGLFEFLVAPDARRIHARTLASVHDEALLAYLLVDALSFSMVRLGWEPLHATAVLMPEGVVAFAGESGSGKSTLAALFVQAGAKLLTDDMLILTRALGGNWLAQPGPPRLKLYRKMARQILGSSTGVPMNSVTEKLIIRLATHQTTTVPGSLARLYCLDGRRGQSDGTPHVEQLSPARAFPLILAHTAGHYPSEPSRLERQLLFAGHLAREVPIKRLSYRRIAKQMVLVRDAVLADLGLDRV